ncbi:MAG: potassium transporter TrkA, partial [Candidatus Omnitrophica bacterium]|nr:potassium transporter TrkA [Candidatus Omnitrophota bacterium]
MIAIFSLLVIILLSIIVVRIGAIALELTGLSPEIASFQAQSAFSGVGFTTMESEAIVTHPLRRRIVRMLILLGSAGITTSIATLVLAFIGQSSKGILVRGETLILGLVLIFVFSRSRHVYGLMKNIITAALQRWTKLRVYDYEQMFGLSEGYAIGKITVSKESLFIDKKLKDLKVELEHILILAIYRKSGSRKQLIGAPHGEEIIK